MFINNTRFQEIDARDLRQSAFHECGHSLVGRHYGAGCSPSIWRTGTNNPKKERLWVGTTRHDSSCLTPDECRQIALAGEMAVWIEENGGPDECIVQSLCTRIERTRKHSYRISNWSRTDWEKSQGWTTADVHAVYIILKKNWKELVAEARELIRLAKEDGNCAKDPDEIHHFWDYVIPGYSDLVAQALAEYKAS